MPDNKYISVEMLVERFAHLHDIPNGPSTSAQIVHLVKIRTDAGEVLTEQAKLYMEQHYESCANEEAQRLVAAE